MSGTSRAFTALTLRLKLITHMTKSLSLPHLLPSSIPENVPKNSSGCHMSRVEHEYLHTLRTCVSVSSSTVKTLKYCVMLSSAVFLTSCTSWPSLQNRVWTGSLCQRAMSPALSFCHHVHSASSSGPLKTHLVSWHNKHYQHSRFLTLNPN